uniref:Uncharacterized protein n=1 Tax=Sphaerodactylus townsendi TaxID=933632 RepID=A0ACB8FW66_9SAUR
MDLRDDSRNISTPSTPSGEALTPLQISPMAASAFQADPPLDPLLCGKGVPAFLPAKKEDRPQPEGASCDAAVGGAAAGLAALTECGHVLMEPDPKVLEGVPKGLGAPLTSVDMLDTRVVMGEETQCLAEEEDAGTAELQALEAAILESSSSEAEQDEADNQALEAFEDLPVQPPRKVTKGLSDRQACLSLPGLQSPELMAAAPLSQGDPLADVPFPPPALAKDLPEELAEAQPLPLKTTCGLDPELYFTAPSTPIKTVFPLLRPPPFSKDSLSEEPGDLDSEGLCSTPTSPSGSYITAEGGSWASSGTASTSPSCSPNLIAESEAMEVPADCGESLPELDLSEGLFRTSCQSPHLEREVAFRTLSSSTLVHALFTAEDDEGVDDGQTTPEEDGDDWGCETAAARMDSWHPEREILSWPKSSGGSAEEAAERSLEGSGHRIFKGESSPAGDTSGERVEPAPSRCSPAAFSGLPSEGPASPPGVCSSDADVSGRLQAEVVTSPLDDGAVSTENDPMIPALLLPFHGSLIFEAEAMEITLFPQGEPVENDVLYSAEDDDSTSASFLHSLSETSINEGVDESFAFQDDTSQSSDSASYNGEEDERLYSIEQYALVPDAAQQEAKPPVEDPGMEASHVGSESEMETSSDAYNTDEEGSASAAGGKASSQGRPQENKTSQEEQIPGNSNLELAGIAALQAVPEREVPGDASECSGRSSYAVSPTGPERGSPLQQDPTASPGAPVCKEEDSQGETGSSCSSLEHQPLSDLREAPGRGVPDSGECLIACFDTDDEAENLPPLDSAPERPQPASQVSGEWIGHVCVGAAIPLGWYPKPYQPVELSATEATDSPTLDIAARLKESEERLLELLDRDDASEGGSPELGRQDSGVLDMDPEKGTAPFVSFLKSSEAAILEQPEVTRADEPVGECLFACFESEDELEEASSLDLMNNNEDHMGVTFSEADPQLLIGLDEAQENTPLAASEVIVETAASLPQGSPLPHESIRVPPEDLGWDLYGARKGSGEPEVESHVGQHLSSQKQDSGKDAPSEPLQQCPETKEFNVRGPQTTESCHVAHGAQDVSREHDEHEGWLGGEAVEPQEASEMMEEGQQLSTSASSDQNWDTPSEEEEVTSEYESGAWLKADSVSENTLRGAASCLHRLEAQPVISEAPGLPDLVSLELQGVSAPPRGLGQPNLRDDNMNLVPAQGIEATDAVGKTSGRGPFLTDSGERRGYQENEVATPSIVADVATSEPIERTQLGSARLPEPLTATNDAELSTPQTADSLLASEKDCYLDTSAQISGAFWSSPSAEKRGDPPVIGARGLQLAEKTFAQALLQGLTSALDPELLWQGKDAAKSSSELPGVSPSHSNADSSFFTALDYSSNETIVLAASPDSERADWLTPEQAKGSAVYVVEESPPLQDRRAAASEPGPLLFEPEPSAETEEGPPQPNVAVCPHHAALAKEQGLASSRREKAQKNATSVSSRIQPLFFASEEEIFLAEPNLAPQGHPQAEAEHAGAADYSGTLNRGPAVADSETVALGSSPATRGRLEPPGALLQRSAGAVGSPDVLTDQQQITSILQGSFGSRKEQRTAGACLKSSLPVAEAQSLRGSLKGGILKNSSGKPMPDSAGVSHLGEAGTSTPLGGPAAGQDHNAPWPTEEGKDGDPLEAEGLETAPEAEGASPSSQETPKGGSCSLVTSVSEEPAKEGICFPKDVGGPPSLRLPKEMPLRALDADLSAKVGNRETPEETTVQDTTRATGSPLVVEGGQEGEAKAEPSDGAEGVGPPVVDSATFLPSDSPSPASQTPQPPGANSETQLLAPPAPELPASLPSELASVSPPPPASSESPQVPVVSPSPMPLPSSKSPPPGPVLASWLPASSTNPEEEPTCAEETPFLLQDSKKPPTEVLQSAGPFMLGRDQLAGSKDSRGRNRLPGNKDSRSKDSLSAREKRVDRGALLLESSSSSERDLPYRCPEIESLREATGMALLGEKKPSVGRGTHEANHKGNFSCSFCIWLPGASAAPEMET